MALEKKTNICCLDLSKPCLDYIKGLELYVYEGSLGSIMNINWGKTQGNYNVPVLLDYSLPENLQEYHIFIYDMGNVKTKEYVLSENNLYKNVEFGSQKYLECSRPVTKYDLRPYCSHVLNEYFEDLGKNHKRISIVFISEYHKRDYIVNEIAFHSPQTIGPFSNYECWIPIDGHHLYGKRVKLIEGQSLSSSLFQEHLNTTEFYRVFPVQTKWVNGESMLDDSYIPLLTDEEGRWVSFIHHEETDRWTFILPQVENKEVLLKSLFENVVLSHFSSFFQEIEAKKWVNKPTYELPNERIIREKIEERTKTYEKELSVLKEEEKKAQDSNKPLKLLLTSSGEELVNAVKSFLEYLGFEHVVDRDSILEEGVKKEEDLFFDYNGQLVIIEVKGINGSSTDAECAQIDKIVPRRMREKSTHLVHGVYVVNNQKNIEPLSRMTPPFNPTQIDDAISQSRTMIYTPQLFSLYSDIENGYVSKEEARDQFLIPGLANFHKSFSSLGVPPKFFHDGKVLCFHLKDTFIKKGNMVFYLDDMQRLVGAQVLKIILDEKTLEEVTSGEVSIEVDKPFPRSKEVFIRI